MQALYARSSRELPAVGHGDRCNDDAQRGGIPRGDGIQFSVTSPHRELELRIVLLAATEAAAGHAVNVRTVCGTTSGSGGRTGLSRSPLRTPPARSGAATGHPGTRHRTVQPTRPDDTGSSVRLPSGHAQPDQG